MKTAIVREAVIQRILESLKKGVKPWRCPWIKKNEPAIPYNGKTKVSYNGVNIFLLWFAAEENGYSKNAWVTMKQCNALGGRILKGEKSTPGFFYDVIEKEVEEKGEKLVRKIPILKHFNLFNWDQTDGLDKPVAPLYDVIESDAMLFAKGYAAHQRIPIFTRGNAACYIPYLDRIYMPETEFFSGEDYISTLLHESVHSTGHQKRLNRFSKLEQQLKDKNQVKAVEELCAELGAAFLTASFGLDGNHLQHDSYIGSWITQLDEDPKWFFKAASEATRAAKYIEFCVKEMHQHVAKAS